MGAALLLPVQPKQVSRIAGWQRAAPIRSVQKDALLHVWRRDPGVKISQRLHDDTLKTLRLTPGENQRRLFGMTAPPPPAFRVILAG